MQSQSQYKAISGVFLAVVMSMMFTYSSQLLAGSSSLSCKRIFKKQGFEKFKSKFDYSVDLSLPILRANYYIMAKTSKQKDLRYKTFRAFVAKADKILGTDRYTKWMDEQVSISIIGDYPAGKRPSLTHGTSLAAYKNIKKNGVLLSSGGSAGVTFAFFAAYKPAHSKWFAQSRGEYDGKPTAHLDIILKDTARIVDLGEDYFRFMETLQDNKEIFSELVKLHPQLKGLRYSIGEQELAHLMGADVLFHEVSYPSNVKNKVDRVLEYAIINPFVIKAVKIRED